MRPFSVLKARLRFRRAKRHLPAGHVLCAVLVDGHAEYFPMPATASDDDVRSRAFQVRNRRPMSRVERQVSEMFADELASNPEDLRARARA